VEEATKAFSAKIVGVHGTFPFSIDKTPHQFELVWNAPFRLQSDLEHGFLRPFFIITKTRTDLEQNCQIGVCAIFCGQHMERNFENFNEVLDALSVEFQHQRMSDPVSQATAESLLRFRPVFDGVASLDEELADVIRGAVTEICLLGLRAWSPLVEMEMKRLKEYTLTGKSNVHPPNDGTIIFPAS
jgi:hypothetical protein